jgi:hypothetical protein
MAWLVRDTFGQAQASGVGWLMLGITGLCVLLFSTLRIEGTGATRLAEDIELTNELGEAMAAPHQNSGSMSLAFGTIRLPLFRDNQSQVRFLLALLAQWVAGAGGTLFVLIWTAGLLPEFLQAGTAQLFLTRPLKRSSILIYKYLSIIIVIGAHATLFVSATWLTVALSTGVWEPCYLFCLPVLIAQFCVFFAFTTLLAVVTRSGVASAFGVLIFWVLCFAMNLGRHSSVVVESRGVGSGGRVPIFGLATESAYWILPKPCDFLVLLQRAVGAREHFRVLPELQAVQDLGTFEPFWSVVSSLVFGVVVLWAACFEFSQVDY